MTTAAANTSTVSLTTPVANASTVPVPSASRARVSEIALLVVIIVLSVALGAALTALVKRSKAGATPWISDRYEPAATPDIGAQVFISHDTEADGDVAHRLARQICNRQLRSWIAPDSIPPGEPWVFAIEQGLIGSRAALVLVSPAALASGWVRREIQMIVDLEINGEIHVVPVRVVPCELPLLLGAYQWVDRGQLRPGSRGPGPSFRPHAIRRPLSC